MRKGRWHGAAVTEGSIRLDVPTKPGSAGKLGRSRSQPAADSSLYAREPPHPSRAGPGPPSPTGKASSGGGIPLPSPGGRCRRSGGRGAVPSRFCVPPHTRQGYALPPSPRRGFFHTRPGLWPCHPLVRRGFFPKILYFHQKQKNCFDKRIERTYNKYNGTEWG